MSTAPSHGPAPALAAPPRDLRLAVYVALGVLAGVGVVVFDLMSESRIGSGTLTGWLAGAHFAIDHSFPILAGALLGVSAHYLRLRKQLFRAAGRGQGGCAAHAAAEGRARPGRLGARGDRIARAQQPAARARAAARRTRFGRRLARRGAPPRSALPGARAGRARPFPPSHAAVDAQPGRAGAAAGRARPHRERRRGRRRCARRRGWLRGAARLRRSGAGDRRSWLRAHDPGEPRGQQHARAARRRPCRRGRSGKDGRSPSVSRARTGAPSCASPTTVPRSPRRCGTRCSSRSGRPRRRASASACQSRGPWRESMRGDLSLDEGAPKSFRLELPARGGP